MTRPIHLPPFMSDMNKAENLSCCCDIKTIGQKHVEVLFISHICLSVKLHCICISQSTMTDSLHGYKEPSFA